MGSLKLFAITIGLLLAAYFALEIHLVLTLVLFVLAMIIGFWALIVNHNEHLRKK